ncbi:phage tail protein [Enterobacter cloacae complex sp. 2024EL-00215]|uniref:gp53-like domain-containing protein n=1 Tax=unclassified Enterobacter cloacae complex TaxID=2757714 RepID=UPI0037515200
MNRQIVYTGAIPLETDLLNTNKYAMLGLAKLASSLMGGNTYVHGLACTPSSPPSMIVNVAAGQVYSLQNIDGTAYSSLPADTTHSILKQGYILDAQQFTLTAPPTAGYSINYLIQVTYSDVDGGSTVLPYYNASNPSSAWTGPNNSGTAQYTVRQGVCTVSLKAGVAATTGTQVTPSPDSGCTGLYVITVAQGATTVTAGNISTYANAPFLPQGGIVDGIQRNAMRYAADTGVANAYIVNINPGVLSLSDGMEISFKAANANTASSTLNVCALGAYPVLNKFGQTLISGEIASGSHVTVKWSSTASSWFILDSTNGVPTVPTAPPGTNSTQEASTAFVRAAITALSLGTASTRDVGTGANQIPDMSAYTSGSGWIRFPDGTTIQSGNASFASGINNIYVNFPRAFSNAGYRVSCVWNDVGVAQSGSGAQTPSNIGISATSKSATRFGLWQGGPGGFNVDWIAIGVS